LIRQRSSARGNRPASISQVRETDAVEAAEQPEGDAGQLAVGIGEDFQQRNAGAQQGAQRHAGQHQDQHRVVAPDPAGQQVDQADRQQASDERQQLHPGQRQAEENAQHRAQPGTGRDAENIRRHQRVAKHALVGGARRSQGAAHQQCGENARQAQLPEHGLDLLRRRLACATQVAGQGVEQIGQAQRVLAGEQGDQQAGEQGDDQQGPGEPWCAPARWQDFPPRPATWLADRFFESVAG